MKTIKEIEDQCLQDGINEMLEMFSIHADLWTEEEKKIALTFYKLGFLKGTTAQLLFNVQKGDK